MFASNNRTVIRAPHFRCLGYIVFVLFTFSGQIAFASIVPYADRANWRTNIGSSTTALEDFETFSSDVFYSPSDPLVLNSGLSVGSFNARESRSKLDVPPIDSEIDVNGSNALGFVTETRPFITFDIPTTAFGADFANFNDNFDRTRIELYSGMDLIGVIEPAVTAVAAAPRFIGFVADSGELISEIRFAKLFDASSSNDNFGVDNVEFVVPEPATLGLLLIMSTLFLAHGTVRVLRIRSDIPKAV